MTISYEHGNEPSDPLKSEEFIDLVSKCKSKLPRKILHHKKLEYTKRGKSAASHLISLKSFSDVLRYSRRMRG